jgi:hypothetical protein
MRALHQAGQHMSSLAVMKAGRNDLMVAANRYVGSWARARELAGIRFERHRPRTAQAWDARTVVDAISERHRRGLGAISRMPLFNQNRVADGPGGAPDSGSSRGRRVFRAWLEPADTGADPAPRRASALRASLPSVA